jgi:ketosteroid isomerase-like protein
MILAHPMCVSNTEPKGMPMLRVLFALLLMMPLLAGASRADDRPAGDQSAIRGVITGQLQAFSSDQDVEAYSYAAPIVQFAFPTVDSFMAMVKKGYQPLHRNNGFSFGETKADATGRPTQSVIIKGTDGKTYEALYTLERQANGSWKIAGCVIKTLPGQEV